MSKRLELETYTYLADHVKAEADRLVKVAEQQIQRLKDAQGNPEQPAIEHLVAIALDDVRRQLERGQLLLVHPSDHRHKAAQSLLAATESSTRWAAPPDDGEPQAEPHEAAAA